MAVSYLKPASNAERAAQRRHRRLTSEPRRMRPGYFVLGGLLMLLVGGAVTVGLVLMSSNASLTADGAALAKVGMPLGGGKIESVTVIGPKHKPIPVVVHGDETIWPKGTIPAHTRVAITVVVKRPGWVAWL